MEKLADVLSRLKMPDGTPPVATADSSSVEQLAAEPACSLCRDVGFVRPEVPVGHPDFGLLRPCRCRQDVIRQQRADRLRHLSNLGPLARLTFDSLSPEGRQPDAGSRQRFRFAVNQARRFADEPDGWLVLLGPPGSGKTHLAAAIANQRLSAGEPVIFSVVPDLLDHLRLTYSPQSEVTYDELFETIRTAPLLILDDLGTQSSTAWAQEKLFQLLNQRYSAQLPTVVTSNHRIDELDERLRSRLTDPALARVCQVDDWEPVLLQQFGALSQERLRGMTFSSFNPGGMSDEPEHAETLRKALKLARDFAATPDGWLVLLGLPGCGKTHLAAAAAHQLISQGHQVCFVTVPDLLDYLRASFAPDSRLRYDRAFDAIRSAPILMLDDLGAHSSTPWAEEKLFQLFNHRYNARLPTLVTSNLPLEDHDARVRSRLLDPLLCHVFPIEAPPYRLKVTERQASRGKSNRRGR